ncbi:unnamed protein product [Orchesella dallaii]|uniref:Uncharacterized protein n=1 Tax=Orchesella dallaii TaxID=48710 RepID=A0ABP1PP51_9HEXA
MKFTLIFTILATIATALVYSLPSPQSIFNVNYRIANQRGSNERYQQRPSVDPSAYYTGANRAKIARHLAQYNF